MAYNYHKDFVWTAFFLFQRIRKFLNVFVNFWLFCNNQCDAISERQQKVEEMAKSGKKLARERNQTLKEIEDLRQKRQTIIIQKEKVSMLMKITCNRKGSFVPVQNVTHRTH